MTDFFYNGCGADVYIGKNIDLVLFRSTPCAEQAEQVEQKYRPELPPCSVPFRGMRGTSGTDGTNTSALSGYLVPSVPPVPFPLWNGTKDDIVRICNFIAGKQKKNVKFVCCLRTIIHTGSVLASVHYDESGQFNVGYG